MRSVVYIAGPFRADKNLTENYNVEFAESLGVYCQKIGKAPIVPHTLIKKGIYGDDSIEEERICGVESTIAITELIAKSHDSEIWIIKKEDNTLSEGTLHELECWKANKITRELPLNIKIKSHLEWKEEMLKI